MQPPLPPPPHKHSCYIVSGSARSPQITCCAAAATLWHFSHTRTPGFHPKPPESARKQPAGVPERGVGLHQLPNSLHGCHMVTNMLLPPPRLSHGNKYVPTTNPAVIWQQMCLLSPPRRAPGTPTPQLVQSLHFLSAPALCFLFCNTCGPGALTHGLGRPRKPGCEDWPLTRGGAAGERKGSLRFPV